MELLRDGHEHRNVLLQDLHGLREVANGSTQPVHMVDHDAVDLLLFNVGQQAAQRRAVHVGLREPVIVVLICQQRPSLAGVPPRIERVEILIQPSSVDFRV